MRGLEARGLVVRRGPRQVLDGLDLHLQPGSLTAVAGANGSGKTTLILALAGLLDLEAGEVRLDGERLHAGRAPAPRARRQRLSLVLQEPWLHQGSALDHMLLALRLHGHSRAEARRRARSALTDVGMEDLEGRDSRQLSGGERQLVALAAALAQETRVLLLDEPTAHLSEAAAQRVEVLVRTRALAGAVVMLATHDRALAERADRLLSMA